jgi:hypothetical protein
MPALGYNAGMKNAFLLFLISSLLILSAVTSSAQAPGEDALTVKARELITAMDKGDFQTAITTADVEPVLRAARAALEAA